MKASTATLPALQTASDPLQVSVADFPHPLRDVYIPRQVEAGLTLAQIALLNPARLDLEFIVIKINGHEIDPRGWGRIRPKPGTHVEILAIAEKGGKSPLRLIATLVVMAAAAWAAPMVAGGLGLPSTMLGVSSTTLVRAGLGFVGNLLVNALIPPPSPKPARQDSAADSPSYFLNGGQNTLPAPGTPIPRVLGRHRMFPYFGAEPYGETIGDDQFLRLLFIWGYGPLLLDDLKIGNTPVTSFEGVEIIHHTSFTRDTPLKIFANTPHTEPLAIELKKSIGWQVRRTEPETEEFILDFSFPLGLALINGSGVKTDKTMELEVQYAPAGTENWSAGIGGVTLPARTVTLDATSGSNRHQYAVIVMDRASGDVSAKYGDSRRLDQALVMPTIAETEVPLARVTLTNSTTTILDAGITDLRTAQAPNRGATGDFRVTESGPSMNVAITGGLLLSEGVTLTEKRGTAFVHSLRFKTLPGEYDVRVRRLTDDVDPNSKTADRHLDKVQWSALRSIRYINPINFPKTLCVTEMRIKASGQLNGVVDRLNGIAHSVLPVWDGSSWSTTAATSNPAALMKEVYQGIAADEALPDSRVGLADLQAFYDFCVAQGYEYNAVIDYKTSVREVIADIGSVARAAPALRDGSKRSLVIDMPQSAVRQVFGPHNSWGYEGALVYRKRPHGLRVRFLNADKDWDRDERLVFDDGYSEDGLEPGTIAATRLEPIEAHGITNGDHAWKFGRYQIAVNKLRPETHSFNVGAEGLRVVRGSLIRFSHDVPKIGGGTGRVREVLYAEDGKITGLRLDNTFEMETGKTYQLLMRLADLSSFVRSVTTVAGKTNTLSFSVPLPAETALEYGNLCAFGETDQHTILLLVKNVTPQRDYTMQLTCVDYNPAIYTATETTIPEWQSNISGATLVPVPSLRAVRSDGSVLLRNPDGSLSNRILISYERPAGISRAAISAVQVRARIEGSQAPWETTTYFDVDSGNISLTEVEAGVTYEFQMRYLVQGRENSLWSDLATHLVIGKEAPPGDVANFFAQQNGETVTVGATPPPDLDYAGIEVRFIRGV